MIAVLNFCQKDRDLALQLLQSMREVGTCRNHELTLQYNIGTAVSGLHQELIVLGTEMFEKCNFRILDVEDERAWPFAANNAWRDYVFFSRMKAAQPWLWLEPDCQFIPKSGCPLCIIQKAYEACGKPFMGAEVTRPEQRMSGVGVYPAYVTAYTKRLPAINPPHGTKFKAVPWDQALAKDIVPNAAFTKLIQHVWNVEFGKPETIPTFPDQESLKLIGPETILFHRCKDFSLGNRLRERQLAMRVAQYGYCEEPSPVLGSPLPKPETVTLNWPHDREENRLRAEAEELRAEIARLKAQIPADPPPPPKGKKPSKASPRLLAALARARQIKKEKATA